MAVITRRSNPGVALLTLKPDPANQLTLPAAAALTAGDMVVINSSGQFAQANGTALGLAANAWGIILRSAAAGSPVTAFHSIEVQYVNSGLTPGNRVFIAATAGALDDAATTGGNVPCGIMTSPTNIYILPPVR